MKKTFLLIAFAISLLSHPSKAIAQSGSVDFQVFYDELSPFGSWIENPDYGYVWIPDVGADFIPYTTNGYWVFTDDGWTWVSDFSWGWAPFHYGRWYTDKRYGSVWVPDYKWGPGWVSWRSSDDYFGWAPMRPGISFNLYFNNHFAVPNNDWTFISGKNFGRRNSNDYYISNSNNTTIIHNTVIINNPRTDASRNVTYSAGPERRDVEKHTGRSVPSYSIRENDHHGQSITNGQMQIYRPTIKPNLNGLKPAPSNIKPLDDVKTKEEKRTEHPQLNQNNSTIRMPQQQQPQNNPPRKLETQQQNIPLQKQEQKQPEPHQRPEQPQPQQRQEQPQQKQNPPPIKTQTPPKQNIPQQKGKETNPRRDTSHQIQPELKILLN